jgi:NitT/TauT family transport system substrate-binding protein
MSVGRGKLAAVAVAAVAALVTACSSSSSGGGADTSSAAASGSGGASSSGGGSGPTTSLTIAYASQGAGFTDLYVGVDDGIFKKHGLNVKLIQVTPANLVPAILSGSVQIGGGVADGTASTILKGEKMKYLALTEGTYNLQLWATSKVKSVQDLVGKSVALTTQGSETDFALTDLLNANNIDPSKVSRKFLVNVPQMLSGLSSGAVAAGLFQPPTAQAATKFGASPVTSLTNLPYAVGAYIASDGYITSHPDVMKNFYAAETESLQFLRSNPAAAKAAIQKHSGDTSPSDATIAYNFFLNVWKKDPSVTPSLIQAAFKRAATKANTSPPSDVTQYIYNAQQ